MQEEAPDSEPQQAEEYVRKIDVYTNTVESAFSLLKRGVIGTWHKLSALKASPSLPWTKCAGVSIIVRTSILFRDTLIKMLEADNVEYKELTADERAA